MTLIKSVSTSILHEQIKNRQYGSDMQKLLEEERKQIHQNHQDCGKAKSDHEYSGLALSGGGIRSASFALGLMQAFAEKDLMKEFDFLSTVSGGGYIGGCLSWWLSSQQRWKNKAKSSGFFVKTKHWLQEVFVSTDKKIEAEEQLPIFGINRSTFPFAVGQDKNSQKKILDHLKGHGNYLAPGNGISIMSLVAIVLRGIALNLLVWVPIMAAIFLALLKIPDFKQQFFSFDVSYQIPFASLALVAGLILCALFLAGSVIYSFSTYGSFSKSSGNKRYIIRRKVEELSAKYLGLIIVLFFTACIPFIYIEMYDYINEVGMGAILFTFFSTIFAYKKTDAKSIIPVNLIATLGAVLFIFALLILSFGLAYEFEDVIYAHSGLAIFALLFCIGMGLFVNLNYISIHRYYRDRLMETFNPDWQTVKDNSTSGAWEANGINLRSLKSCTPYPIINTNVVLVDSPDKRRKLRGGDNFILSPLFCGSNATGWMPSTDFLGGDLTLPTAVAISGAAANPNTGAGGVGITRNKAVSLLMALLNLRLGYWVPNPRKNKKTLKFNHLYSMWKELFPGKGYNESHKAIQLSDGGHFENLGLYELVRRQLRFIVVSDAGADPDFSFVDLLNAIRRVDEDFGAKVSFNKKGHELKKLIPTAAASAGFPSDTKTAQKGFIEGSVRYANGEIGAIIFVKTTYLNDLDIKLQGYKGANPSFPDQSTADQFFSEEQFEAYRELGFSIGESVGAIICPDTDTDIENYLKIRLAEIKSQGE